MHDRALQAARAEKGTRLQDKLLNPVATDKFWIVGQPYHPEALVKMVGDGSQQGVALSPADARLLVEAASGIVREVAKREPRQLLKLTEAVETVTLEGMIAHVRERMWQTLDSGIGSASCRTTSSSCDWLRRAGALFQGEATVGSRTYGLRARVGVVGASHVARMSGLPKKSVRR